MPNPRPDLIRFRARAARAIRDFFETRDVVEVEVPMMVPSPGMEPHLRAFRVRAVEAQRYRDHYLHTSPEYAIKAALGDLDFDVYAMVRSFRDEPLGPMHHPEFTMLEWYRQGVDYTQLMRDVEDLIAALRRALELPNAVDTPLPVALDAPFERLTCAEAFSRYAGIELLDADTRALAAAADRLGIDADVSWGWDGLFTVLYAEVIEPQLGSPRPTFITEFPASQAALARLKPGQRDVAERFEFYLGGRWDRPPYAGGVELANAFSELIDPVEQRARFDEERAYRSRSGLDVYPMPEAMLDGIARMRPTAGIALGVERLLAWLWTAKTGEHVRVSDFLVGATT